LGTAHNDPSAGFKSQRGGRNSGRQFQPQGGNSSQGGGGSGGLNTPKAIHKGRLVCFNFNQASGCGRKQGAPDACVDRKGTLYAHYCNFFDRNTGKHCFAQHPRIQFH
jgi:hypothetical protein